MVSTSLVVIAILRSQSFSRCKSTVTPMLAMIPPGATISSQVMKLAGSPNRTVFVGDQMTHGAEKGFGMTTHGRSGHATDRRVSASCRSSKHRRTIARTALGSRTRYANRAEGPTGAGARRSGRLKTANRSTDHTENAQRNRNELGETTVNKTWRKHLPGREKSIT